MPSHKPADNAAIASAAAGQDSGAAGADAARRSETFPASDTALVPNTGMPRDTIPPPARLPAPAANMRTRALPAG